MQLNVFGVVWLIVILFAVSRGIKELGYLYIWSFIFQGNCMFYIGSQGISVSVFTGLVFVIVFVLSKMKLYATREFKAWIAFLVTIFAITLVASQIFVGVEIFDSFSANGYNILTTKEYDGSWGAYRFIILLVYIMASTQLAVIFDQEDFIHLINTIKRMASFVLIIGAIQFVITLAQSNTLATVYNAVFHTNVSSFTGLEDFFGSPRLISTFIEPSYCATFLAAAFWSLLILDERTWLKKYFLPIGIEIVLTFSATAYVTFLIGGVLYILVDGRLSAVKNIMLIAVAALVIILFSGSFDSIISVVVGKLNSNSGVTRTAWNQMAWQNFLDTHGFGIGYRNIRASSMFFNLLGQIGVLGTMAFCYALYRNCKNSFMNINSDTSIGGGYRFASIFFLVTLVAQFVACPDLDNCNLWLALTICLLTPKQYVLVEE